MARQACQSAVTDLGKTVKSYKALLGADATTAALKTDATGVKDVKTLDALKRAVGAETPAMVKCDASDKTGLDEATAKADKTAKGVKAAAKALQSAVKAVESSKLDKTVADADGLYRATEGKVQDDKTRDALKQAIAKRDADAIAKAVRAVNDSKTAKDQADAEATAKAQADRRPQPRRPPHSRPNSRRRRNARTRTVRIRPAAGPVPPVDSPIPADRIQADRKARVAAPRAGTPPRQASTTTGKTK